MVAPPNNRPFTLIVDPWQTCKSGPTAVAVNVFIFMVKFLDDPLFPQGLNAVTEIL